MHSLLLALIILTNRKWDQSSLCISLTYTKYPTFYAKFIDINEIRICAAPLYLRFLRRLRRVKLKIQHSFLAGFPFSFV
jgi:hypothetical protein